MLEIVSNTPEILIDLDNDIATTLSISDAVTVKVEGKAFTGTVSAISRAANANLLYTTRISIPDALKYIGSAATVSFQGSREADSLSTISQSIVLPLKSIKIISEQE